MKNEYIIISKTTIQKRIEELEGLMLNKWQQDELRRLRILISQSTPLIPEIKKAFNAGCAYTIGSYKDFKQIHPDKKNYISNLKLDI